MNITQAVSRIATDFIYSAKNGDLWRVMKLENRTHPDDATRIIRAYFGDCEDFSLTSQFEACDRSWLKFIWAILTGRAQIHRVIPTKGDNRGNHAVGVMDGYWFDNWTLQAFDEDTFFDETWHDYKFRRNRFVILWKLSGKYGYAALTISIAAATYGLIQVLQ